MKQNGAKAPAAKTNRSPRKAAFPAIEVQREVKPTSDDIQRRAYEIYLGRLASGEPGCCQTDWERAERELLRR